MEVITFGPNMDLSSKKRRQIGRIDGVIETLNRTEGEMPEIIAGVLKRIRDDIDKFVDNKTKDYENI